MRFNLDLDDSYGRHGTPVQTSAGGQSFRGDTTVDRYKKLYEKSRITSNINMTSIMRSELCDIETAAVLLPLFSRCSMNQGFVEMFPVSNLCFSNKTAPWPRENVVYTFNFHDVVQIHTIVAPAGFPALPITYRYGGQPQLLAFGS